MCCMSLRIERGKAQSTHHTSSYAIGIFANLGRNERGRSCVNSSSMWCSQRQHTRDAADESKIWSTVLSIFLSQIMLLESCGDSKLSKSRSTSSRSHCAEPILQTVQHRSSLNRSTKLYLYPVSTLIWKIDMGWLPAHKF
jgi:hypothetical protein